MRVSAKTCVIANCVLKFTNFRYNGNKGRSGRRLNDNVSLARTVTPTPSPIRCWRCSTLAGASPLGRINEDQRLMRRP